MGNNPFRWGILGPGRIANKFAVSLPFSQNGILAGVASRDISRASEFGGRFGSPIIFGSYEEMIKSGEIDAVYVSTPHAFHFEHSELCLRHSIPVLCEKPLTMNPEQTRQLTEISKSQNTFLMEGMWTAFLPHFLQCQKWIYEGRIGEVVHVQADFGYKADFNPTDRKYNPALGGSVTKDVGIYPLTLFYKILGMPTSLQTLGSRATTGIDEHVVFQGINSNQATFQGMVSFRAQSDVEATIIGTEGKIKISSQWLRPVSAVLICKEETVVFEKKVGSLGFQFEADEVEKCVRNGETESKIWSHEDSRRISELIAQVEAV
jgi:dihydrodiol dehydrogenase / D-xylose 1-dehydrogenase (NADP)